MFLGYKTNTIADDDFKKILLYQSEYVKSGRAMQDVLKLMSLQFDTLNNRKKYD